jgi:hypothetical protein
MILPNGIGDGQVLLFNQIMIELADAVQMTVDGFGLQSLPHEIINVMRDRCMNDVF